MSPVVSRKQYKKFFALYRDKKITKKQLDEWTRGVSYKDLPVKKAQKKRAPKKRGGK